jgi:FkbM family methyltransferase
VRRLKQIVKKSFHLAGLNISRITKTPLPPSALLHHEIELLFDVGANAGQYALYSRQQGYTGNIVSFEPLSQAHEVLMENAKSDRKWIIHERCALGSTPGEAEINISQNSYSSSLLPMLDAHSDAAADSISCGKEYVKILTLDSIFNTYRRNKERVFLKIDTQGYEKQVLDGANDCIKQIKGVQLELSVVPLYETQELYEYFFRLFKDNGFELWSILPGFSDAKTGRMLQFDGIFVRPPC